MHRSLVALPDGRPDGRTDDRVTERVRTVAAAWLNHAAASAGSGVVFDVFDAARTVLMLYAGPIQE